MLTSRRIGGGPGCCARAGSTNSAIAAITNAAVFLAFKVLRSLSTWPFPRGRGSRRCCAGCHGQPLFQQHLHRAFDGNAHRSLFPILPGVGFESGNCLPPSLAGESAPGLPEVQGGARARSRILLLGESGRGNGARSHRTRDGDAAETGAARGTQRSICGNLCPRGKATSKGSAKP